LGRSNPSWRFARFLFRFCAIALLLRAMRIITVFAALGLLAACSDSDDDAGPGGVSTGEAEALDEAAEMLEARRLPVEALPETAGDNAPLPPEIPDQEGADGSDQDTGDQDSGDQESGGAE
jgi:hypothetical protein